MALSRYPFVGRRADVERVRQGVTGRARLVLVEGDAGMGKTRLVDEALSRTEPAPSPIVLRGTADRDAVRPMAAFVDALGDTVASWSGVPDELRRHRDAVAVLFGNSSRSASALRELSPFELHDGLLAVLGSRLRRQHGALVLDDLHWGDEETITSVGRVARSSVPCTVVAMARIDESCDQLLELVEDIDRHHEVVRVRVGALGRDDVAELLRTTHGAHAAMNADVVHERTGGHPLLLVQLLESGALPAPDLSALPSSAEESIRRRLLALGRTARDVLNDVAVFGPSIRYDELRALSGLSDVQLTPALRELCDHRLLVETAADEFTFGHALMRQVVEAAMLVRERRAAHRRVLAMLPPDTSDARIVHHAVAGEDFVLARVAAARGAPMALAAGQPNRARAMSTLAIGADPDDAASLAVLAQASWQLRDRDISRDAAERVLALTDGNLVVTARMRWLLARLALESLDAAEFRHHVDELESLVHVATLAEIPELLTICAELKMLAAEPDEVAWGERAASATVGTPLEIRARLNLGSSLPNERGRRQEGRDMLLDIIRARTCDSLSLARALNNLLCDFVYAAPPDTVAPLIDEFEGHVTATALIAAFAEQVPLYREQCAERLGDGDLARAALAWFGPVEPEPHTCLAAAMAFLELDSGRPGRMCHNVATEGERWRDRIDQNRLVWSDAVGVETMVRSSHEGADVDNDALLERLFDATVLPKRFALDAVDCRGRVALVLARRGMAEATATLTRWRQWVGDDPEALAVTAHLEAVVAEWRGDHTTAIERYRISLDGLPIRACTVQADALRGLARCAAAIGEREAARGWARQAVATLTRWPGAGLDDSVRLLRKLGGRPAPSGVDRLLSDRETEVAALVARGMTNREIGESLGIATRTVGVHVSHILEKVGVSKRSEIAAHVARREALDGVSPTPASA